MAVKSYMIRSIIKQKFSPKFLGNLGESKKYHRSRRIGPAMTNIPTIVTSNISRRSMMYAVVKNSRNAGLNVLLRDPHGNMRYQKAHCGVSLGDFIPFRPNAIPKDWGYPLGVSQHLGSFRTGTLVFRLSLRNGRGNFIASAPGTACKVLWHWIRGGLTMVRIPSKKLIRISHLLFALAGRNAISDNRKLIKGCARKNLISYKKTRSVRGVARNPVDHPNGGRANTKQPLKNP